MESAEKMGESACLRRSFSDSSSDPRMVCMKNRKFQIFPVSIFHFRFWSICFGFLIDPPLGIARKIFLD